MDARTVNDLPPAATIVGCTGSGCRDYRCRAQVCCKTFLALDLAVSVAAGTPCLRRFPVSRAGRLLYAEDPLDIAPRRLDEICAASGLEDRPVSQKEERELKFLENLLGLFEVMEGAPGEHASANACVGQASEVRTDALGVRNAAITFKH
jgi:hypothetical protein